jgi:regulator of RNase E activity RraA
MMAAEVTVDDERLERVTAASLVDGMGRIHSHRADILGLVSPSPPRRLFGRVATIAYQPYREDLPHPEFGALYHEALGEAAAGAVLVLSSGGYPEASHGGGIKLSRLKHSRAAGVLADGRLRDFAELSDHGFATWCRGEATRAGGETVMPYAANVPVEIGGVSVVPGDYIYAAADGAVVIPRGLIDRVLDEAIKVEDEDAKFAQQIADEAS